LQALVVLLLMLEKLKHREKLTPKLLRVPLLLVLLPVPTVVTIVAGIRITVVLVVLDTVVVTQVVLRRLALLRVVQT
jgi:hypothetical protein